MLIYIPIKEGDFPSGEVLQSIPKDCDVYIHPLWDDPNKTRNENIAANRLACFQKAIKAQEEFFCMMDADIHIVDPTIIDQLVKKLISLPDWGALTVNTDPGKIIDHFCNRFVVFRTAAVKCIKYANIKKFLVDCIAMTVEMRQAGWNLGYYKINITNFVKHLRPMVYVLG